MALTKVLVAEDEPDIQKIVTMSLRLKGYEVHMTNDGQELLSRVQSVRPDLILLDVAMPRLDGFDTCRRLKADPLTAKIPVIFLSASTQKFQMDAGLQLGAVGYLMKPFDPMTLADQLNDILKELPDFERSAT